ncbi:putative RING-type zinc-finger [Lyophyllum shimeji]|uniref:RING-type zinc-finger n=1 Tax=Lyophyllum shimeji TaxID=47721 RepID=A0A9P3ULW5_LYOSH|nr:putative RING-type zinc-finger [Lyophyllum shimeji]
MISVQSSHPATPKRVQKMASSQNVNHLLNFTLPPRQTRPPVSIPRRSRKTGTQHGVWNKERFVNAQYRFVMDPTGDYTVHFADPDIFFQWQDILQVIVPRSSALASAASSGAQSGQEEGNTTCPICLSPPTAPRMTKCGHVFCFPCILHYLGTSDNKWARCPICFDSVNEKQLKTVKWYEGPPGETGPLQASSSSSMLDDPFDIVPRAGSTMLMRLVQRPQITTLALPRSHSWPSDLLPPHQAPFHFLPDVYSFAKFMLATPAYLLSDLSKDLDDLVVEHRILAGMNDELGMSFVDAAEQRVRIQMAKAAALETPALKDQIDKAVRDHQEIEERFASHERRRKAGEVTPLAPSEVPEELLAVKSARTTHSATAVPNIESTPRSVPGHNRSGPRQRRNVNPPPPSTSTFYYYQAASGLPLFLHPLDIKILLAHFKNYSAFPDTIAIRVESFAESTVNDDLRKRCKYLSHMPEGTDVVFIEADLSDVVGTEGLKNFEGALKTRTLRKEQKERKDDRARARAEERERERERSNISSNWAHPVSSPPSFISPAHEEHEMPEGETAPIATSPPIAGAWGARSFASALHSAPPAAHQRSQRRDVVDDWDVDDAWHELERNAGGRKKRGTRLVILGSGGGGGRRR